MSHHPLRPLLLEQLSLPLLERAFQYLADPQESKPPPELQHLNNLEWYAVQNLLSALLLEQALHPMQ